MWEKAQKGLIACAVATVLIANSPAVIVDPFVTAFSQIRNKPAVTTPPVVSLPPEMTISETSVPKARILLNKLSDLIN
jgi:hypothetical protein